jgi:hypothetical protein
LDVSIGSNDTDGTRGIFADYRCKLDWLLASLFAESRTCAFTRLYVTIAIYKSGLTNIARLLSGTIAKSGQFDITDLFAEFAVVLTNVTTLWPIKPLCTEISSLQSDKPIV